MNWHRLPSGQHAGKTLPEVMLIEPDVLDGFEDEVRGEIDDDGDGR